MHLYYILSGVLGFLTGYIFDLPLVARSRPLRVAFGFIHMTLLAYGFAGLAAIPEQLQAVPCWVSYLAWLSTGVFVLLFIYSVFIEISVHSWLLGFGKRQVVKTGSYAMCRHPGNIWLMFVMASLALATRSLWLSVTLPIWIAMDLVWVWIQEKFCFPELLPGYESYKREVPMLIPTWKSTRQAITTILPRGSRKQ